jgi:predicted GNAT family N-acyltransferase
MDPIHIQNINAQHPLFTQVFDLREKVLRKPLGISLHNEDTSADEKDVIWIAIKNHHVIACLMLKDQGKGVLKLRQMAVDADLQGKGIGRLLIQKAEKEAQNLGFSKIELHARQYAQGFYERLGYTVSGQIFEEVGLPHVFMDKLL